MGAITTAGSQYVVSDRFDSKREKDLQIDVWNEYRFDLVLVVFARQRRTGAEERTMMCTNQINLSATPD